MKLILFLFSFFLVSCSSRPQRVAILTIELFNDTCYYFKDSTNTAQLEIDRNLEILENTLTDTIILGSAVLPSGYIGSSEYRRVSDTANAPYAPDIELSFLPKTKSICVNLYQTRPVHGKLRIKYHF